MSAIQTLPEARNFGLGFNYSTWTAGTAVTLCKVRWNSDYRDIVEFENQAALDDYLKLDSGPVIDITRLSYAKFGRPIRLDVPYNVVQGYNYLRAYNPSQPVSGDVGRAFYYFITDLNYVNPNCTEIFVQVDVWQTFGFGITFGNCYIERGHYGIANENNFTSYGRNYLTVPEGLDIGNEYVIQKQYSHVVASARFDTPGIPGMPYYSVLVTSNTSLDTDPGTEDKPKLVAAKGSQMENLPNGAEMYLFNSMGHFKSWVEAMQDKPWVMQGIMNIQAVPRMDRYGVSLTSTTISGVPVYEINPGPLNNVRVPVRANWRESIDLGRYRNLKKFLTAPYMVIEMTTYSGNPLILKPECWQDENMGIVEVPHFAPPGARLLFYPLRYNAGGVGETVDSNGTINDGGEFMDMFTGITNFPAFSILNNSYIQYMASNANSIAYQHSSADWSQQKALRGNSTSYDQASAGINLSKDLNAQGINAANAQNSISNTAAGYHAIQSGINSLGSAGSGNVIGAAMGIANAGANYAVTTGENNARNAVSNQLSQGQNRASNDTAGYMRDTNKGLADWSANGDYENQIAGINAKVQDAKLTQPTTAGQVGGDAFNLATYRWGVDMKVKMLQPAAMNSIGEYWLRYGYAINRFGTMPESLMVMEKFTYWKLKETYITEANCPEAYKQAIRGIFEKGVTVWKNPLDIGTIDLADNEPLEGIAF